MSPESSLEPGDVVCINNPTMPHLHGLLAFVTTPVEWGAHVSIGCWKPGTAPPEHHSYRAGWAEMVYVGYLQEALDPAPEPSEVAPQVAPSLGALIPVGAPRVIEAHTLAPVVQYAREQGYTGDPCFQCGGMRVVRNGACLLCRDCGASSGCS